MKLIVENLDTFVKVEGSGEPVLMLHGWQDSHKGFDNLADILKNDYKLIIPDLPGFGASQMSDDAWGVGDYAEFTKKLAKKLDIKSFKAIVGHSMGGRIAMKIAAGDLLKTDKIVLLSSAGIPENKSVRTKLFASAAKLGKILSAPLPRKTRKSLRRKLYGAAGATDYLEAGSLKDTFTKIVNEDARDYAGKIKAETLLIYGAEDVDTPPTFGKELAELIPKSKMVVLDGLNHFAHKNAPDKIVGLIKDFL